MWSLVSGANTNFDGLSRLYGVDAALSEDGAVKEGVAGPIGKFDESNPFSGLNHLTTPWTGGPEGASKGDRLNRGRVPKARGCG